MLRTILLLLNILVLLFINYNLNLLLIRNMIVTTPQALGAWFQTVRKQKGLTQTEVAKRSLLSQKVISEFENGKSNVTISTLLRILAALQLTIDLVESDIEKENQEIPW